MDQDTRAILWAASAGALISHIFIRRYGLACLVTVLVAPLLICAESLVRLHLPPAKLSWMPFVYMTFMIYSVPSVTIIGMPFHAWRQVAMRKG